MRIGIDIDVAPPRMGIMLRPYPNIAIRIDEEVRNPFKVLVLLLDAILFAECKRAAKNADCRSLPPPEGGIRWSRDTRPSRGVGQCSAEKDASYERLNSSRDLKMKGLD